MNADDRAMLRQVMEAHSTITLATCGKVGTDVDAGAGGDAGTDTGLVRPWAAAVFYASDADLNVYFVSDERTRHGRHMTADTRVAGAINRDMDTWDEVLGIQLEGDAVVLEGNARERALATYLQKFPDVQRLFGAPRDDHEWVIASRLRSTPFWRLSPRWIRLVDNARGFGWKAEFILP